MLHVDQFIALGHRTHERFGDEELPPRIRPLEHRIIDLEYQIEKERTLEDLSLDFDAGPSE